ncbi:hypothetical protein DFQ12_5343 [Sphingobacterium detergens]|uniref:Uncharacterized protein n=1 Tax=Sphingobacterium detergens TaxID=1145106 RepID=A0A420AGC1_SPHD1|nr:hypothetical protein [Sphingobacterium sp. BIGb0165]RKE43557.1 hypothetical protein DFQ12_5343 [Sphingobacterium detergens]
MLYVTKSLKSMKNNRKVLNLLNKPSLCYIPYKDFNRAIEFYLISISQK